MLRRPANWKTELCKYYSSPLGCNRGSGCSYAHGKHELRLFPKTVTQAVDASYKGRTFSVNNGTLRSSLSSLTDGVSESSRFLEPRATAFNEKRKTILCKHIEKSGNCPYNTKCTFIHPTDKEYEPAKRLQREQKQFNSELKELHSKKNNFLKECDELSKRKNAENLRCFKGRTTKEQREEKEELERKIKKLNEYISQKDKIILMIVKTWNKKRLKGPDYYDFHWLTVDIAIGYIEEVIKTENGVKVARIETGVGNRSVDGTPRIKQTLLRKYQEDRRVSFQQDPRNDGILILTIH